MFDNDGATKTFIHEEIDEFKYLRSIRRSERPEKPTTKEFSDIIFTPKIFLKASSKSHMTLKDYGRLGFYGSLWDADLKRLSIKIPSCLLS